MGNRAVISFKSEPKIGIYLHWNGGRASVEAFLAEAKRRQLRADDYGVARLAQLIGEFFTYSESTIDVNPDYSLSLGVGLTSTLDCNNGDNGHYFISDSFEIVHREHTSELASAYNPREREQFDGIGDFFKGMHRRAVARNRKAAKRQKEEREKLRTD